MLGGDAESEGTGSDFIQVQTIASKQGGLFCILALEALLHVRS